MLIDHGYGAHLGAVLLRNPHWRCVWFDPITAVFVHGSSVPASRVPSVDFAARHFRPDCKDQPRSLDSLIASAKAIRNYLGAIPAERGDLIRPLAWLGFDDARRIIQVAPESSDGWQSVGQIEMLRAALPERAPRYRLPYDPIEDLSAVRADLCTAACARDRTGRFHHLDDT